MNCSAVLLLVAVTSKAYSVRPEFAAFESDVSVAPFQLAPRRAREASTA